LSTSQTAVALGIRMSVMVFSGCRK